MKLIFKIAFIMIVLIGCSENKEQNKNIQSSGIMLGEFSIEGMMCEKGCKSYIDNKVSKLEGVDECNVDYDLKLMTVEYDLASIDADKIIMHVNSLVDGQYNAKLIQENEVKQENYEMFGLNPLIITIYFLSLMISGLFFTNISIYAWYFLAI